MKKRRQEAHSVRGVNYATSPLLASKTPAWRSRLLVALLGLAFVGLLGRAAWLQLVNAEYYQKRGDERFNHRLSTPASRGSIFDRNGQLLATSVPVPSIWAIPKDFQASPEQRKRLARLLGYTDRELEQRLASGSRQFAWLKRRVDPEVWTAVQKLGIKGLYQEGEYRRKYPEGETTAHVVGFTNLDDQGLEGVERAFEKDLQGREGTRGVVKDRFGRVIDDIGLEAQAADGRDLHLSIDAKVQYFAYRRVREAVAEHRAKAGSVVVLDAQTGEVLALANYPSYDPAARSGMSGDALRNRALTDTFEPGSTVKPFVMAWALETGLVKPGSMVNATPGSMVVSGFTIKDAHAYGWLSAQSVIQKSSNIGTVRLAMQIPPHEMWELYSRVGFGQKPQIDFPGVATGRLRPYKSWRPVERATMAYGYGLSSSLLQISRAYTAFARDGEVIPLTLLRQDGPVAGQRVFSAATARELRKMLQMAAGEGGTAPKAQTLGYSVGGKSGTAHKQEGSGYATNKYRSWFVGLAPVDKPRIIVGVMVDEPGNGVYFGGAVAAPVFSQVVQQTLRVMGVPPDLEVKPQVVAQALPAAPETTTSN